MKTGKPEVTKAGKETTKIVNYIASFRYEDIPLDVVQQAKMIVLDTLGVTLAARIKDTEISRIITEFVHALDQKRESTLIGTLYMSSCLNAAFANATMAHDIIELDEVHSKANTHTAAVIVPTALAVCEKEKKTGKDLIAAVVLGYDVECRLAVALDDKAMYARCFHPTSVCGCFGAVAAAAKLLGLDKKEIRNALGLAGCQASGLIAWETEPLHMSKSFQAGIPARNGITATLLAQLKYIGPPAIFDGKYNVFDAFSDKHNYELVTEGLGTRFDIMGAGIKQYSCCRHIHSPLDAFLELLDSYALSPEEIEKITVRVSETAALMTDNNELVTHNAQHVLAMAAFDKEVKVEQYREQRYKNPEVQELSRKIKLIADPDLQKLYPLKWVAIVTVDTKDGRSFTKRVDHAKGDPENPFSPEDIKEKFLSLTVDGIGIDRSQQIIDILEELGKMEDIRELSLLLRA